MNSIEAELTREIISLKRKLERLEAGEFATAQLIRLAAPLTSASWDGDSFSTTAKTLLDLGAVFGVPDNAKAVLVRVAVQDSGAATTDSWLCLSPNDTAGEGIFFACFPSNDKWNRMGGMVVPCNADGNVYYQLSASGASTLDVNIQIWGYWL